MASNPFGGLGASSSSNDFGGLPQPTYKPPKKKKSKINKAAVLAILRSNAPEAHKAIALAQAGLTPRQTATALAAVKQQGHRSFGDKLRGVGKGALGGATWTLDKLMRPSWGVTAATEAVLEGQGIQGAVEHGIEGVRGKERMGFGEVLDKHGVLEGHNFTRGAVGFGLDVVTDPLMLLSLPADIPTGGGATAAYLAAKTAGKAIAPKIARQAAEEAGKKALAGSTDDIVEELLKQGGKDFQSRHALLQLNKAAKERPIMGMTHEEAVAQRANLDIATSIAKKEALENDKRKVYLRYGTRKHHVQVPLFPALSRPGQKIARAGIPVISQLSDRLGRGFIPDWKNPLVRSGQVARQHVAEQNAVMQRQMIGKIFNGVDETMDPDHLLAALHYMEQPLKTTRGGKWKAVVGDDEKGYRLNERYISLLKRRGLLDNSQEDAVRRYFEATESMYKFDRAAGVEVEHFGKTGRFYVPHIVKRDGESAVPTISQRNLLTEAGFQKHRKGGMSILQIKQLVDDGLLPTDIETNPFRLLAHRSRAGAERQADMALINTLKASIGVPTRIVSEKSVARANKRLEAAVTKYEAAIRAAAHAEGSYKQNIEKIKADLARVAGEAEKAYAKKAKELRGTAKAGGIKKLEDAIKRASKPRKGTISAADKAIIAEAKQAHEQAKAVLDSIPEDSPRHNAKIVGILRSENDHLDDAITDWEEIRRTDYEKGPDGTEEFQGEKQAAWDDVRQAQEDHLAEIEDDATTTIKDINDKYKGAVPADLEKVKALEAELRKLKASSITTPELTKLNVRFVKLKKELDDALTAMDNPRTKMHQEAVGESQLAHKTAKEAAADAKKEMKAAKAQLAKAKKGKANKAVRPGMDVDSRAKDIYGNTFAFPQEAASAFLRLERIVSGDDATVDNFIRSFGKWQGAWKVMVTIMNPGYRIRNTMTDMWNMWLSGIGPKALGFYGTRAARTMKHAAEGDPRAFGWIQEAADHGILSGLFAGDIARVEKYFQYGGKSARALRKDHRYISLTTKVMQDMNKNAENWGRLTHYMWRRQGLGEDAAEAAMRVKLAHFDYEDLTPFEQKLRDSVFPFYTWTRKNIPYQVKKIFQEPGRYSAFPKLAQEATYASGSQGDPVPEFVETGMGFPIGGGKYYMPQFGVSDLTPFQGPGEPFDRAAQMLSPAIKTPIELYQNKSFFTGQPIADERHPRAPVTGLGASLLSLLPGSNVGPTSRKGANGDITGPGANPYMAYLLGQTPITRLAGVTGPGSIGAQRSGNAALTSWLGGQSIVSSDPQQQAYYDSLELQAQVDKFLQGLRDAGTMPTTKRKKGVVDKIIEEVLRGNNG